MSKKGYLLIDVLIGLSIFGIVVVTCMPMLSTALNNRKMTKQKLDMVYTAESIMEQIKGFDSNNSESYMIYDMDISELINKLDSQEEKNVYLPTDYKIDDLEYYCIIKKESIDNKLWKITVEIILEGENEEKNVSLWCIIQNPRKD